MKKSELTNMVNKLHLKEEAKNRIICRAINCKEEKEKKYMSKKKVGVLLVAATLVLGVVVYAASGIVTSWFSSSSALPEYTKLPTEQECIDDIGYAPVLIEKFENGYVFDDASIVNNSLKDEAGKAVEKFKSIDLRYDKNGDEILMSANKYVSELEISGDVVENIDGTDIYYNKYKNKLVPGNYEMTDEDKKAEESGELVFSYGANEVTISEIQNLYFENDGIKYTLTQIDGKASVDELISMASEIINE